MVRQPRCEEPLDRSTIALHFPFGSGRERDTTMLHVTVRTVDAWVHTRKSHARTRHVSMRGRGRVGARATPLSLLPRKQLLRRARYVRASTNKVVGPLPAAADTLHDGRRWRAVESGCGGRAVSYAMRMHSHVAHAPPPKRLRHALGSAPDQCRQLINVVSTRPLTPPRSRCAIGHACRMSW